MINLIPPKGHKAVRKEYLMRLVATFCVLFAFVAILLSVALIPTYVLVQAQMRGFSEDGAAHTDGEDIKGIEEELARTEAILAQLKKIPDDPALSSIIAEVETSASPGVTFRTFTLGYEKNILGPIIVQGVAERREDLVALKQAIESHELFESASVPLADLARESDVPFTITIMLSESTQ